MPKFCPSCGAPLQNENAGHCTNCGAAITAQPAQAPPVAQPMAQQYAIQSQKNPIIAVILCFFFPGLGQVYNGDLKRGIMFIAGQFIGSLLLFIPGLIVWVYAMYDAYTTANKMNAGQVPYAETNITEVIIYFVALIIATVIFVIIWFVMMAVLFGMFGFLL